jgi:hypothetical protein
MTRVVVVSGNAVTGEFPVLRSRQFAVVVAAALVETQSFDLVASWQTL